MDNCIVFVNIHKVQEIISLLQNGTSHILTNFVLHEYFIFVNSINILETSKTP